jgi:hypothetical protein
MSYGEKVFYLVLVVSLIMVNPPVLTRVNEYAAANLLTGGYPTLWFWLQVWYGVMILDSLLGAIFIASWRKRYEE